MKDELVMVVRNGDLFNGENAYNYFQGHALPKECRFDKRILEKHIFVEKKTADNHPDYLFYKQPISYGAIFNPFTNKFYISQRAKSDKDYSERRLQGSISIGVGGHIIKEDLGGDPFYNSLSRELEEEVEIHGDFDIREDFLAYINIDQIIGSYSDRILKNLEDVSIRHFGLLYLIVTNAERVVPKKEHILGDMFPLKKLDEFKKEGFIIEPWTNISRIVLEDGLKNLIQ